MSEGGDAPAQVQDISAAPKQESMVEAADRPDEIVIRTCTIGGHLMGGARAVKKGYEEKWNCEEALAKEGAKPVDVRIEHAAPFFLYFTVTKKKGDAEETKGGCCSCAFHQMLNMVYCCCNQKMARKFADDY